MKITDVTTTLLRQPGSPGIQDATIRHRDSGRSALFVHIRTDAGFEGLGMGQPAGTRELIERTLKPLLTPHPCIESAHPSPLSAHNGFFGSKPFSRANAMLAEQGAEPIDWRLP